jgi:hypothetical protein
MAFNPARDPGLRKLDSDHLFETVGATSVAHPRVDHRHAVD